jgi:nucleoside-triphosphatase
MNRIFIVTGPTGSGKSVFLSQLVTALQAEKIRISGFVADKHFPADRDYFYEIRDVQSGRSIMLSSREPAEGWLKTGNFYFNPLAVAYGNELLTGLQNRDTDLIVIDEIGPFELEGRMWAGAVSRLLAETDLPMIWVVRYGLVEQVIRKWDLRRPVLIDIDRNSASQTVKKILSKLAASH